jgi:hypothetical protein
LLVFSHRWTNRGDFELRATDGYLAMSASIEMSTEGLGTSPVDKIQPATANSDEKMLTYVGVWLGMNAKDQLTHCILVSAFTHDRAASDAAGVAGLMHAQGAELTKYRLAHLIRGRDIQMLVAPDDVRSIPAAGSADAAMAEKYLATMRAIPADGVIKPRELAPPGGAALG